MEIKGTKYESLYFFDNSEYEREVAAFERLCRDDKEFGDEMNQSRNRVKKYLTKLRWEKTKGVLP